MNVNVQSVVKLTCYEANKIVLKRFYCSSIYVENISRQL